MWVDGIGRDRGCYSSCSPRPKQQNQKLPATKSFTLSRQASRNEQLLDRIDTAPIRHCTPNTLHPVIRSPPSALSTVLISFDIPPVP